MKKPFSQRMLTSFSLLLSFLLLLISGVILYIFPGGNGAGFIPEFSGLTKPAWLNQHIIFSIIFSLLSLYHLFFINRKPFISYLKKKTSDGRQRTAELLTALILTAFVAIGTYAHLQPYSGMLNTGKKIAGAMERKDDEGLSLQDNTTTYPERFHRYGFEKHYEERHASPRLAFRREEPEETAGTNFDSSSGNSGSQPMNNGAPDDELHRRTTASCASCH